MRTFLTAVALLATTAMTTVPAQSATFEFGGGTVLANDTVFTSNANTSLLTVGGPIPDGNQPLNIQCIICGTNQPQQDGSFAYNNYKQGGNITTFATSSTSSFAANGKGDELDNNTLGTGYLVSFLKAFLLANLPGTFDIGIDVNTADGKGAEILNRFVVVDIVNKTILADTGVINMALPTLNNGSGFPDYTITGFDINRNDLSANSQILFLARWSNTSDGAESFFLTSNTLAPPVPLPAAGWLFLTGIAGLGFLARRKRKQQAVAA